MRFRTNCRLAESLYLRQPNKNGMHASGQALCVASGIKSGRQAPVLAFIGGQCGPFKTCL